MKLQQVDEAISVCEAHLNSSKAARTQIESYLTQALLVLTCAAFEEQIETILEKRAITLKDANMARFFHSCVSAVFRSPKSSEIAGLLNRFGPRFKESFQKRAEADPVAVTYYNNIVTNRHGAAHANLINCSFPELKAFYEKGHQVLDYLEATVNETLGP